MNEEILINVTPQETRVALVQHEDDRALSRGRYHVAYEDIVALATPVLRHRILLNFHAESDRIDSDEILRRLLETIPPPKEA